MKQASQQARLTEKSEVKRQARAQEFFGGVHNSAQPGTAVRFKHGEIEASYTKAMPPTPTAPKPGRVPVKKNRGGKKPL